MPGQTRGELDGIFISGCRGGNSFGFYGGLLFVGFISRSNTNGVYLEASSGKED